MQASSPLKVSETVLDLEGLVSKRRDRRYRGGRSKDWIKVKNRTHPAMTRIMDAHANRDDQRS